MSCSCRSKKSAMVCVVKALSCHGMLIVAVRPSLRKMIVLFQSSVVLLERQEELEYDEDGELLPLSVDGGVL